MARTQGVKTFAEKILNLDDIKPDPVESISEEDLADIDIDEEQAKDGLEKGLNSAIKKGVQKGAEEAVLPAAQNVAKKIVSEVIGGKHTSPVDEILDKEKKITELEMLQAVKNKYLQNHQPQQQQQLSDNQLLQIILLLKDKGFNTDEIIRYIRLMKGGSDPLMIMELLTPKQQQPAQNAPHGDNTLAVLIPLLMSMNQQQHQPPPQPQNSGINEVLAVFMQTIAQMQQQTMSILQQMQQQSKESNERFIQMMMETEKVKQELLINQLRPAIERSDPDEELVEAAERFKKLKEIFAPATEKYQIPVNKDLLEHEQVMTQLKHDNEIERIKMENELREKEKQERLLEKITEIAEKGIAALQAKAVTQSGSSAAEDFAKRMAVLRERAKQQEQEPPKIEEPKEPDLFGVVQ